MIDQLKKDSDHFGERPEVEAHSFAITHLSMSPGGFLLETDQTVPKVENLHLDQSEKALIGDGVKREMAFNGVEALRAARRIWKDEPDNVELEAAFYEARADYQKKGKKIGLRNIHVEDDVIHADVQMVHFPNYTLFGQPGQSEAIERISRLIAVSMIVRTADNRLIVQHRAAEEQHLRRDGRTRGNAMYPDIPGASVAGMFDASLESSNRQPGRPDPVDTDDVLGAIYKEAGEELGLAPSDFEAVRITGLAEDKVKVHEEFLLLADTPLTAAEIRQTSRLSNRNKNLGDADFEEKFFDIDASSGALDRLLTDVKCPLAPTHAAALVAAGFSLALEEGGSDYALAWRDQIEQGIRDNYDRMDTMVRTYYERFPEALNQIPERYWGRHVPPRNPIGYDPAYTPEEQGLPSFEDEMVRAELLPETRQTVKSAAIFKVNDLLPESADQATELANIAREVVDQLKAGAPVLLNGDQSVRSIEQIGESIKDAVGDRYVLLERLLIVGEKGQGWVTFDKNGEPFYGKAQTLEIEDLDGGERVGADRFLQYLADLNLKVEEFQIFGDGPSNEIIVDELLRRGRNISH